MKPQDPYLGLLPKHGNENFYRTNDPVSSIYKMSSSMCGGVEGEEVNIKIGLRNLSTKLSKWILFGSWLQLPSCQKVFLTQLEMQQWRSVMRNRYPFSQMSSGKALICYRYLQRHLRNEIKTCWRSALTRKASWGVTQRRSVAGEPVGMQCLHPSRLCVFTKS